jgi:hypothetical protein
MNATREVYVDYDPPMPSRATGARGLRAGRRGLLAGSLTTLLATVIACQPEPREPRGGQASVMQTTPPSASLAITSLTPPSDGADRDAGAEASAPKPAPPGGRNGNDEPLAMAGDNSESELLRTPVDGSMKWTKLPLPPLALDRVCDLRVLYRHMPNAPEGVRPQALYAAHARSPLGTDGATISVLADLPSKLCSAPNKCALGPWSRKHTVAFDWNRIGEPAKGGGAGQGFVRIRRLRGRLFVPDADPPYAGFGFADWGTEGFVFASDASGKFAPVRHPKHWPPVEPTAEAAGASVLPRAYHVIDVIEYAGALFASTGSVPPKERAWAGPSPGALHRATPDLRRFKYEVGYPLPYQDNVFRLTYMVRFRGELIAGIQDYDGSHSHSYVVFGVNEEVAQADAAKPQDENAKGTPEAPAPNPSGKSASSKNAAAKSETAAIEGSPIRLITNVMLPDAATDGSIQTLRWYADGDDLYWIGFGRRTRSAKLRVSQDGRSWRVIDLPSSAGEPTDILRSGAELLIMTERELLTLQKDGTVVSRLTHNLPKSPFARSDFFCTTPIAIFEGQLYAGGQREGAIYRLDAPAAQ